MQPPATVTTTSTVIVPPPNVTVTPTADTGLHGWAVPIATLVAALIAATFLTINEMLKRRREDRRQWDKEIRDQCIECMKAADVIAEGLDLPPDLDIESVLADWSREVDALRTRSRLYMAIQGINPLRKQARESFLQLFGSFDGSQKVVIDHTARRSKRTAALEKIRASYETLALMADVETTNCAAQLHSVCAEAIRFSSERRSDDESGIEAYRAMIKDARLNLIVIVRTNIRSPLGTPEQHHENLKQSSWVYRNLPRAGQRIYHRRVISRPLRR